jgi:hypothetical protein
MAEEELEGLGEQCEVVEWEKAGKQKSPVHEQNALQETTKQR